MILVYKWNHLSMAPDSILRFGKMGYRMAVNMRKKMPPSCTLHVYDVVESACQRFVEECSAFGKIEIAKSSKEVATKCQTLPTVMPTGDNVRQVFLDQQNGVIAAPKDENQLMVECSTIDIKATRDIGKQIMEAGMGTYIDAPVSCGVRGAKEGTIAFLVGYPGSPDTDPIARRIASVVSYMGLPERVNFCGELGSGLVGKIVNNYISINNVLSLAEGMAFGKRYGVDKMTLYNCVKAFSGNSWVLERTRFPALLRGRL